MRGLILPSHCPQTERLRLHRRVYGDDARVWAARRNARRRPARAFAAYYKAATTQAFCIALEQARQRRIGQTPRLATGPGLPNSASEATMEVEASITGLIASRSDDTDENKAEDALACVEPRIEGYAWSRTRRRRDVHHG